MEPSDPFVVGLFRPKTVVLPPESIPHLIHQFGIARRHFLYAIFSEKWPRNPIQAKKSREFRENGNSPNSELGLSHMSQVHHIGRCEVGERELFSLALPDFPSLPDSLSLPSGHFIAFLAADASDIEAKVLVEFSRRLIRAGCVYFCTWGADCGSVHDVFDGECLDVDPVIMTTWHSEDSLDEALWFFLRTAFPDDGYWDTTRSGLAISVGRPDWDEHIRTRLGDIDSLTKDVVDET